MNCGCNQQDEFYLGVLLKCPDSNEVRCCGVSIERVVGSKSLSTTKLSITEDASMASEVTTPSLSNFEITSISNANDINTEENELNESPTTYDNEIETTLAYNTTELYQATESDEVIKSDQTEKLDETTEFDKTTKLNDDDNLSTTLPTFVDGSTISNKDVITVYPSAKFEDPNKEKSLTDSAVNVIYPAIPDFDSISESNDIEPEIITEQYVQEITTEKISDDLIATVNPILESTTILPNVDSQENDVDASSIATTTVQTVSTFPDLISTMEAIGPMRPRKNKRRNSSTHFTSTTSVPSTKPIKIKQRTTESTPLENASKKFASRSESTRKRFPNTRKPKNSTSVLDSDVKMAIDAEHKEKIVALHSLLTNVDRQSDKRRPLVQRSKTFQQLIANEKLMFKPNFGLNHHYSKNISEPVTPAAEIETTTQTEKPKRKYNRRLPGNRFGNTSSDTPNTTTTTTTIKTTTTTSTTTTTTATPLPNKSDKESTTARYRFNKRKQTTPKIESTTPKIIESKVSKDSKPNDTLQNKPIDMEAALKRRQNLFATRKRGGWSKLEKPSDSTAENLV